MSFTGRKRNIWKRTACRIIIAVLLLCGVCSVSAEEPNQISNEYKVRDTNGLEITYYNAGSKQFSSPGLFIKELLGARVPQYNEDTNRDNDSMALLWLRAAVKIFSTTKSPFPTWADSATDDDRKTILASALRQLGSEAVVTDDKVSVGNLHLTDYSSLKAAEEGMTGGKNTKKQFSSADNNQVFAIGVDINPIDSNNKGWNRVVAYFSDFQAVALLPDAGTSGNYVSTIRQSGGAEDGTTVASNVMNLSSTTVNATQTLSSSHTATVTSTVNGSSSYSYSEGIKVGQEFNFFSVGKTSVELSFTATQAFTSGWSKSDSVSDTSSESRSVSVTLPPYTNVMLKQMNTMTEQETKYNCPVGIKYKVHLVLYSEGSSDMYTFGAGSNDARDDLYRRAYQNYGLEHSDPDNISWSKTPLYIQDILQITNYVPVSTAGGKFDATLKTVTNEVDGILPVYPLRMVALKAPDVSFISDKPVSYSSFNYLTAQMHVGDFSYTNYLDVQGYNIMGAEYYGFSKFKGHWIVTDALSNTNNNGMDPARAPVKLEKDPVSGNMRYTAVRPGTCYLKYIIDEDVYNTASNQTGYTKNADLLKTAALQIEVTEKLQYVPKVEATCEKDGHIAYYKSASTGRMYEDEDGKKELTKEAVVIPAVGHSWSEWITIEDKNNNNQKIEIRTCRHDSKHIEQRVADDAANGGAGTAASGPDRFLLLQAGKGTKKYFCLKWNMVSGATSYEIYGGECGDSYEKICTLHNSNNNVKIRKIRGASLKRNKYYRFFVVAYGQGTNGTVEIGRSVPIYLLKKGSGKYGNIKKVVLNSPTTISLKKGQTSVVSAVQKKASKKKVKIHDSVRYVSSNPAVAAVGQSNGVVTAIGKGTCEIYCIGQDGKFKTVTVSCTD